MFGKIKRAVYKKTLGKWKYRSPEGYDAERYWHDRFVKYGGSILGPGHEGLTEHENIKQYDVAARVFMEVCQLELIDFPNTRVLEIGCGNGFYTQILKNMGVRDYTGIDITDARFPDLERRFPDYRFIKRDITDDLIEGKFDLVIMIDVLQHIVTDRKLHNAMINVKHYMGKHGKFILSSICQKGKKQHFYVRNWTYQDVKQWFPGYLFGVPTPFRGSSIAVIEPPLNMINWKNFAKPL